DGIGDACDDCLQLVPVVYGISNGFDNPAGNQIYQINLANGDLSNIVQVTLPAFTVRRSTALAARPSDGALFAVVQTATGGPGNRRLITVDPTTGVSTDIGPLSEAIASLAFRSNGTLYAVSGEGGAHPETLFTLSTSNATLTLACVLGNGDNGET